MPVSLLLKPVFRHLPNIVSSSIII